MQAVILAAGLGTRMRPLTNTVAKPLVKIGERTLLDYTFDALPGEVNEVIVVVGYLGEQVRAYLGDTFRGKKIQYVVQEKLEGTAKALWEAKPLLKGKFLVLMADDIYAKSDIEKCITYDNAMLVARQTVPGPGGRVVLSERGELRDVIEEESVAIGKLVGTNVFVLTPEIFNYEQVKKSPESNEYGLPQTVVRMSLEHPVKIVEATKWIKVTTPEDLKTAESNLDQG